MWLQCNSSSLNISWWMKELQIVHRHLVSLRCARLWNGRYCQRCRSLPPRATFRWSQRPGCAHGLQDFDNSRATLLVWPVCLVFTRAWLLPRFCLGNARRSERCGFGSGFAAFHMKRRPRPVFDRLIVRVGNFEFSNVLPNICRQSPSDLFMQSTCKNYHWVQELETLTGVAWDWNIDCLLVSSWIFQ